MPKKSKKRVVFKGYESTKEAIDSYIEKNPEIKSADFIDAAITSYIDGFNNVEEAPKEVQAPQPSNLWITRKGDRNEWKTGEAIVIVAPTKADAERYLPEFPDVLRAPLHPVEDFTPGHFGILYIEQAS